jgi:hypothetical protein
MEECGTARHRIPDNIILLLTFEFWLEIVTDTHSEIVERIAFSRQQKIHNRTSMLKLHVQRLTFLCLCW